MGGGVPELQVRPREPDRLHDQRQLRHLGGGLAQLRPGEPDRLHGQRQHGRQCPANRAGNPGGGIYNYSEPLWGKTTLVDTIVAGNTGSGGAASDIGGDNAAASPARTT